MILFWKLNIKQTNKLEIRKELEKKIPDVADLLNKTKLTEIGGKIQDVSFLATKTALTGVENNIPSVCNLVKKKQTMT